MTQHLADGDQIDVILDFLLSQGVAIDMDTPFAHAGSLCELGNCVVDLYWTKRFVVSGNCYETVI